MALLEVDDLHIRYEPKRHAAVDAVTDVSFRIEPGEFVGLIGESGSGKTTLGMALLRLLERPGRIAGGTIVFDGTDITDLGPDELRAFRWTDIATVFQSSMNSLNPVVRIEGQFRDVIEYHSERRGDAVLERIKTLFDMVLIDHKFITAYPHELSGGMKQRVNLALSLAIEPRLVLLDEPTTGLDVVVQRSILENVRRLQAELGFAVLFISHDIGTVLDLSDRILVMYAGTIVEEQPAERLLHDPLHPYTKGLLGSYGDPRDETVRITYVPGRPPDLSTTIVGCAFAPRCPEKIARCTTLEPPLERVGGGRVACHVARLQRHDIDADDEVGPITRVFVGPQFVKSADESTVALDREVLLSVEGVSKTFVQRRRTTVTRTDAVKDASFVLHRGGVTALVGQSGSGKSTLARMITGVERPTSGTITFHGGDADLVVDGLRGRRLRDYRRHVQMVFQDPYSALNPAKTLGYILSRPLVNYQGLRGAAVRERVMELLETVALTPAGRFYNRFGYELSGGQRQRVVIARALAVEPGLIIADEPISSLDVSIRAEVLELLNRLVHDRDVSILYITHDLLSARMLSDEVVVLNNGVVVEQGRSLEVIRHPQDDYTRLLLQAIPNPFEDVPAGDRPAGHRGVLAADLVRLGVTTGDTVMVHTSMRGLGYVVGGEAAVLDALRTAVGAAGTLVMPTQSWQLCDPAFLREPHVPQSWWSTLREHLPAYDPRRTPTRTMGRSLSLFRTQPGSSRSSHPHRSITANGPRATEIVARHDLDCPAGERSPLAALYAVGGTALLLGVGADKLTCLHLAEHRARFPGRQLVANGGPVLVDGVRRWLTWEELQVADDDFPDVVASFEADGGRVRSGTVGQATAQLLPIRDLVDFAAEWFSQHRAASLDSRGP